MTNRILSSLAFVVGGIAAFYVSFVLGALQGFGAAQAGMGAGAGSRASSGDAVLLWPICLYFAVSAVGLAVCRKRDSLEITASLAHVFLLLALLALCVGGMGSSGGLLMGLLLPVVVLVFLSPWLALWAVILFRSKKT